MSLAASTRAISFYSCLFLLSCLGPLLTLFTRLRSFMRVRTFTSWFCNREFPPLRGFFSRACRNILPLRPALAYPLFSSESPFFFSKRSPPTTLQRESLSRIQTSKPVSKLNHDSPQLFPPRSDVSRRGCQRLHSPLCGCAAPPKRSHTSTRPWKPNATSGQLSGFQNGACPLAQSPRPLPVRIFAPHLPLGPAQSRLAKLFFPLIKSPVDLSVSQPLYHPKPQIVFHFPSSFVRQQTCSGASLLPLR